jgi:exodeoxyribonuclease V alpha subunit
VLEPVADAVRRGDAASALAALRGGSPGVRFHEDAPDPLAFRDALLAPWRELRSVREPRVALDLAGRARVLTALREGPQGAAMLNARIELALAGPHREAYFHGRLLLVTENDARNGLYNGDVGVCLRGEGGVPLAWFDGPDGPRAFHPAALPAHASAFAMTVHKAQGSEFDTVWLQLPLADTRVLSRELVYTALTRARSALHVLAPATVIEAALARHAQRVSGLAGRLGCVSTAA